MEFTYTVPNGRGHAPLQLYAVQGEAGARTFTLNLTGGGAVGGTAYVYVLKNDGTLVVIDASGTTGIVTFTLPLQACTCPGKNKVYIQLIDGQVETRWDNIELWVQPCDLENAVASTDDLGPLADIITDPDYLEEIQNAYITAKNNLDALMEQFSPKGEYNPSTAYKALNIVSQNGSSYVAIQDTQGNPPTNTTYWQLLAERGEQGKQGVQGEPGQPGSGLEIAGGPYATPGEVPSPENGSCYLVGASAPYDVYYRSNDRWTNLGPIQGAEGPQGQQGDPGQAATIQVGQVTTGEPGSQATVTNSGTENAAVLNFAIPQGATGQTGPTGPAPNLEIGTVSTLPAGQNATASITGTTPNFALNLGLPRGESGASTWNDITDKPSEFPPKAHTQAISTITGLQSQLNSINNLLPDQQMADYIISAGTSGIWKYERYYSGKLHIWGNIPVNNVGVTTTLGSLYRSGNAYTASRYGFPLHFSSAPTISMTFVSTNSSSAFVWPNPAEVSDLRYDPCNCYLVRPTSGTASGWVCYDAWGDYN